MTVYLKSNPNVKAVIIGTRSSDPGCTNVEFMQPSDGNWPKMMRVNPIIKWRYSDIWSFIRYVWFQLSNKMSIATNFSHKILSLKLVFLAKVSYLE